MPDLLKIHLKDVLLDACAVLEEQHGEPPNRETEKLMAQRIVHLASLGERDPDRLCAMALEGLIAGDYVIWRPLLN